MNAVPRYELFISYRRDGGLEYARMIFLELKGRGYNVFFDYNSLRDGKFNEEIFTAIDECKYFILILSTGALDRCNKENDWVRCEIEYALLKNKPIIPVCPAGSVRGFPEKMPESFEPLRNRQISMLLMDDLFEKSVDKIVEDRFDKEFNKGRSPVGSDGGVTNKSFTKIGWGVVAAILVAAAAVATAILTLKRTNDHVGDQIENDHTVDRTNMMIVNGQYISADSSEGCAARRAFDLSREIRPLLMLLKDNGWNTADPEFVQAGVDFELGEDAFGAEKWQQACDNYVKAKKRCEELVDKLVEQKLSAIDGQIAELELSGDRELRKRLELVKKILPINPKNQKVLAAQQELENVLFPRMVVTAVYEGKEVPATFTLDIATLRLDGPCTFCKRKGKTVLDPNCVFCKRRPQGRNWLELYYGRNEYMGDEIYQPAGMEIKTPKEIQTRKGDIVGTLSAKYLKDSVAYLGKSDRIVANWNGTTNVVILLHAVEQIKVGETRVVPLPRREKIEFVWCPPGTFSFEYREPGSIALKQGKVSVQAGFWISKYEISGAQTRAVSSFWSDAEGNMPYAFGGKFACQYARGVQNLVGGEMRIRLPTAEEWEYAAHYGDFVVTEENVKEYGWLDEPGEEQKIVGGKMWQWKYHESGRKKPTPLGLYDMYGNAEEWTIGSIDATLGLNTPSGTCEMCPKCGRVKTVRGGGVRIAASNAVQILTRDYMRGRDPDASSLYRKEGLYDRRQSRIGFTGAIRLVADELPSQDRINKLFGGRHWICEECGEFKISIATPDERGCNKGNHKWNWLEDVGTAKYRCKNCGKELLVRGRPQEIYVRICPGPKDKPRRKDFMGREETFKHEWEKVKED